MVRGARGLGVTVRIAFVHSFYRSENPSGEKAVVEAEISALRRAGHEVALFAVSTDDLHNDALYMIRTALRVAVGRGRNPLRAIHEFDPDVVHVHNLFPNFGREWVRDLDIPLVVTLHNYRHLCAKATLFRDGHICTLCPDGARWAGVRYACYRDSRLATLPIAWANRRGVVSDPVLDRADVVVCLSERMRDLYVQQGVAENKVLIFPNFLPNEFDPGPVLETPSEDAPWLFVGRLGEEKGILPLLDRWPTDHLLQVVGDGPLRREVDRRADVRSNIEVLGKLPRMKVLELMGESIGLVFPSRWYEGSPVTYIEALAVGTPVLAFPPNVVADRVGREGTGVVARLEGTLDRGLGRASARFPSLRAKCRRVFEGSYSEIAYLRHVEDLYGRSR